MLLRSLIRTEIPNAFVNLMYVVAQVLAQCHFRASITFERKAVTMAMCWRERKAPRNAMGDYHLLEFRQTILIQLSTSPANDPARNGNSE